MELYTTHFLCDQAHRTAPSRQFFYTQVNWKTAPISLDLGCGTGVITPELTSSSRAQAIGLDINPESVERANHLFAAEGLNHVQAYVHDAAQVPFYTGEMELQESAFDVVVATSSIYNKS